MNLDTGNLALALGIGLVTGMFSGAFGIGGGTVSTPLLRLTMSVDPHVSIGTTMALIIPTSISATFNYFRKKEIELKMGLIMVLPAILGVVLGAKATTMVHGTALMIAFAGFVFVVGLDLSFGVVQKLFRRSAEQTPEDLKASHANERKSPLVLVAIGLAAGFMAGFFGVGGGFIFVPCLMYLFKTPIKTAFGTSLLVVAAISIPGTITHAIHDHVNFPLMLSMMGGSIPGSFVGSTVALKLKDSWLRRGFGVVMLMVAALLAGNELTHHYLALPETLEE